MYNKADFADIPHINNVILYTETDSTNTRAKELLRKGENTETGTLLLADRQTAGRGRMGRSFSSPAGEGIYMSLILKPELSPEKYHMITLLAAMAISQAFENLYKIKADIKWPNDILVHEKKLVGILTEGVLPDYVILGIGINVNNQSFPEQLTNAGSLLLETGKPQDRSVLVREVLICFYELYDSFLSTGDLAFIKDAYNSKLLHLNKEIYVIPYERTKQIENSYELSTEGLTPVLCLGIEKNGALICKDAAGNLIYVNSGEVSIRESE